MASAHLIFGKPLFFASLHYRHGAAQLCGKTVATFGLLLVIGSCARFRPLAAAYSVGAYITAADWFTASTSFANPAVTLARSASNTFAAIRPVDVAPFVLAQLSGAVTATISFDGLSPGLSISRKHTALPPGEPPRQ